MVSFEDSELINIAIHHVGNKIQEEPLEITDELVDFNPEIKLLLKQYFTKFFKDQPLYHFHHNEDPRFNEGYHYASEFFADPEQLLQVSKKIAQHLYDSTDHPNIKSGECHLVHFDNVYFGDEVCDVLGIFKSENKDTFIKVFPEGGRYNLEKEEGININKLDKGCLIFNVSAEEGYRMMVIDRTNPSHEAQYWTEQFLKARQVEDNYFHTAHYMKMCKDFASEAFPEASKADQLALVNESKQYFNEQEIFDKRSFHEKVLQEPEVIEAFENYKSDYQQTNEIQVHDEFDIAPTAVKHLKRVFKSVIKLDKNFHIYVHGNRDLIRKGYDEESGMNFYQVFYKEEH